MEKTLAYMEENLQEIGLSHKWIKKKLLGVSTTSNECIDISKKPNTLFFLK